MSRWEKPMSPFTGMVVIGIIIIALVIMMKGCPGE